MVTPSSSPESVDSLFEQWLDAFEEGGEGFEGFVARHDVQAAELRRLHTAWRRLQAALPESAAAAPTLMTLTDGSMAEGRRSSAAPAVELRAGEFVGEYRLVRQLGAGGMGQVWEAEQLSLGRRVALKMLRPERGYVGGERLLHEARAAGRINHPGIVPVFAAGEAGGVHFVVQQIVGNGTTLADLIEARRETGVPSALRLAALFIDIAEALHAAHEQGILHRDLKPRNILIDPDGRPRVSDFGLAARLGEIGSRGLVGTCAYMSPEQAAGGLSLDRRSDVFSLGAVLYEALTLQRPFDGESITDVLDAVQHAPPPNPSRRMRDVPEDLAAVCLRALEKDPNARYGSMRSLEDDLRRLLAHEPVLARRPSTAGRAWRWSRRHPGSAVGLLLGGVSLVVVAALLVRESGLRHEAESRAAEARAQGYLANLRAAASHLQRGNPIEALQRLEACAPELRGWEWQHAALLVNSSVTLLTGHAGGATAVAVTPDGRRVVTGAADSTVRGWSVGGVQLGSFGSSVGSIRSLVVSENGRRLAVLGERGDVQIRDAQSDALIAVLREGASPWAAIALSPDGSRAVACARDGRVIAWDDRGLTTLPGAPPPTIDIASATLSADGSTLVTGSPYGVVTLWPLDGVLGPLQLNDYERGPAVVAVSRDGQVVAAGMPDGSVRCWASPDWELRTTVAAHDRPVSVLAVSADGRFAASASTGDEPVVLADIATGERMASFAGHGGRVVSLAVTGDGRRVVSGCLDGAAYAWDRLAPDPVRELSGAGPRPQSLAASADGRVVAWNDGRDARISVLRDGEPAVWSFGPASIAAVALDAAGALLAAGSHDGTVQLVDVRTGRRTGTLRAGLTGDSVEALALLDGGARVLAAAGSTLVRLDVAGGARLELMGHSAPITALAVSTDGRRAATASVDGTVRLWDVVAGTGVVVERGEPFDDNVIALDGPGAQLAVALAAGGAIRLYDTASLAPRGQITDLESGVPCLAFSEDGSRLFTAAYNGRLLRVWDPHQPENLIDFEQHAAGTSALLFAAGEIYVVSTDGRIEARESVRR